MSEDSTLLASPTSVRSASIPPSPTLGSPLAASSSRTSDSSTVAAGRSPSVSPSTKAAKRFLGSAAIGGLLRRKKSTTGEPKVEKLTKAELKEAKKREAIEKKKEVPVPVSSVKKRVAELEAAAKEKEAKGESGKGSPVPVQLDSAPASRSETPTSSAVVLPVSSPASPATDSSHTPIEYHRAAVGSPTPTTDDSNAPSTPTAQSHFDLPDSPPSPSPPSPTLVYHPKDSPSEPQEELHSGASTPSSSEHEQASANGEGGPVLHSFASSTSLAETTTSFQTADSEQSV